MSGFSAEWLELREPADARARSSNVANALAARFQMRDAIRVVDLGSGTGANLRATAPLLPSRQTWVLTDRDPVMHDAAKVKLARWADESRQDGDNLVLTKDGRTMSVTFANVDLAKDTASVLDETPHLVTASAFLDLVSEDYIRALVKAVAARRAAFLSVLTYSGLHKWTPHRPADNRMAAAFHHHQTRDKGFGPAAGPSAVGFLADQFRLSGYLVLEDESPWRLGRSDRMLIDELVRGHAVAVTETGAVDAKTIVDWVNVARTDAYIGHVDTFAVPS